MERFGNHRSAQEHGEQQPMLLYIRETKQAGMALQRAAQRIKCNVRHDDLVLLLNEACGIVLFDTTFAGAQAVARRIYTLLADIDYELQIVSGLAAQLLLQRLRNEGAATVSEFEEPVDSAPLQEAGQGSNEDDDLPYLAFLVNYPSHRLLHQFPYELACRYRCVPVGAERDFITVATCQRLTHEVIARFREETRRNIFQVRCESGIIDDVLHYWQNRIQRRQNASTS